MKRIFFKNKQQDQKLAVLFACSKPGFLFDSKKNNARLMASIASVELAPASGRGFRAILKPATATLVLAIMITSTLAYANTSTPGDLLYFLDIVQEDVLLTMPLPNESRAAIKTKIAEERSQELSHLKEQNGSVPIEVQITTAEKAQRILTEAVEDASRVKQQSEQRGKDKTVKNMDKVMARLQQAALEQETALEKIRSAQTNKPSAQNMERLKLNLEQIKTARERLDHELGRVDDNDGFGDENNENEQDNRQLNR
jgi:hypothetical protein